MVNWQLLTPRNFVVIGAIVIIWHIALSQVFNSMGQTDDGE